MRSAPDRLRAAGPRGASDAGPSLPVVAFLAAPYGPLVVAVVTANLLALVDYRRL